MKKLMALMMSLPALILVLLVLTIHKTYFTIQTHEVVVNKTERVIDKDAGEARYLVYTDLGVYENTDSVLHWKWDSSDVHGELTEGETYRLTSYGYRIKLLSMYRNITEVEKVNAAN